MNNAADAYAFEIAVGIVPDSFIVTTEGYEYHNMTEEAIRQIVDSIEWEDYYNYKITPYEGTDEEFDKLILIYDGESMKEKLNQFKAEFAKEIFKKADEGAISKEVALDLLTVYDLLPVAPWIELPAFLESYDYFDRYSTIKYMNYLDIADFKDEDGNVSQYTQFPDLTWDEAINELYEFVKEKQVIGCVYDW